MWLDIRWDRFNKIPDNDERLKFTTTWLSRTSNWSKSNFNNEGRVNNLDEEWEIVDGVENDYTDVIIDIEDEVTRELVLDILNKYGEERGRKILSVRYIYLNKLSLQERVLYDLYFTQMLSTRKIASKIGIPVMATYLMISNLKNKIKECLN
jgi:DNA-directed RNA polymerase specialized sigma subunit